MLSLANILNGSFATGTPGNHIGNAAKHTKRGGSPLYFAQLVAYFTPQLQILPSQSEVSEVSEEESDVNDGTEDDQE